MVWNKNMENKSLGEEEMKAFGSLLLELQVAKDAISSLRSRYRYNIHRYNIQPSLLKIVIYRVFLRNRYFSSSVQKNNKNMNIFEFLCWFLLNIGEIIKLCFIILVFGL